MKAKIIYIVKSLSKLEYLGIPNPNYLRELKEILKKGAFQSNIATLLFTLDSLCLITKETQQQMHRSITINVARIGAPVCYDITNYYFETDLDYEPLELK